MKRTVWHRELIFDPKVPGCFRPLTKREIQARRSPKPEPVDVYRGDPKEKLWKIAGLPDEDGHLRLALDAILYFFFGNQDDHNAFVKDNLYRCRYVNTHPDGHHIHDEVGNWLFERCVWGRLLATEPLHVCYDELVRPLREFIAELYRQIEERKECVL